MKKYSFSRLTLCVLCGTLLMPALASAGWVPQASNTTLPLNDVCFVDSLYGWAVGGRMGWPDTTFLVALRTTDGGATWLKSWETTGSGFLKTVTFINRFHGWAMADSGLSVETTDGGVSWHNLPSPNLALVPFAERFVNDTFGYMLAGIRHMGMVDWSDVGWTTDGGLTWSGRIPRAQQPNWLVGLDIQGPRWAWATGRHDSMVLTRDAATTWVVNYLQDINGWNFGVAFGDSLIGVAVGGLISRTSNGGFNWVQYPKPVTQVLTSAEMPDTSYTWACGERGTIIASTDGGRNWNAQTSGTQLMLWKIWFVNERQGWAVGDSGVILHTDDGGRSGVWEEPSRLIPYASRLTVLPNPFVSFATLPGHEAERFSLYDVSGRKVGTNRGDRVGEGLAPGVYFLRSSDNQGKPLRIVKVR
jgi:photosystem II stability/assembly factor-like uncharacterized protein